MYSTLSRKSGNTNLTFLTTDHLGSTSATYRADSGATTSQRYMPWGKPRCASAAPDGSLTTRYTYIGQYSNALDARDFGLLYYNALIKCRSIRGTTLARTVCPGGFYRPGGGIVIAGTAAVIGVTAVAGVLSGTQAFGNLSQAATC